MKATINSEQFKDICNSVWSNRVTILGGGSDLSGEIALLRAVFWRLCKAGVRSIGYVNNHGSQPSVLAYQSIVSHMLKVNSRPEFDGAPILKELIDRYQNEVETTPVLNKAIL